MTFNEVIQNNCANTSPVNWWPRYAYHYTDISNVVNILSSDKLYSRIKATELHLMSNDNASRQVIDMTGSRATGLVRFYFRPLTPTQYNNEGYKHKRLRYDGDENANVPVPVFFLFNLEKLLGQQETRFSQWSQAGYGVESYKGVDQFALLDFGKIYSKGAADQDIIKYRHAELSYPDSYPITGNLEFILCRSDVEKSTLMNLIYRRDAKLFYKYKDLIRVSRSDTFEKNGFLISDIIYHNNSLNISFSNTNQKYRYYDRLRSGLDGSELEKLHCEINLYWLSSKKITIFEKRAEIKVDYFANSILMKLENVVNAKILLVDFFVEGCLLCSIEYSLVDSEIV